MCPNEGRLTLVLGPTNTGKTHLAVERMLGHTSGIIGLPLRLLAREIYDRVVARRGPRSVALITGEEKIVPPNPSYYVSTVEAMPLRQNVAFVAVDEIQLCADPERGHVFTDRLLRVRGREETMFLGAQTIGPILRHLLPDAEVVSRPRFSKLIHTGVTKLSRLPRRSAIVAFSANDVYALAELIRRQKGGAAVVMGALSPRTRNAQVALYQDGAVDYLVATDAIGMGLNMDIDHVAFASLTKFDGQSLRPLRAAEIAQIAGRAGRHMNDGSFGTLGASGDFSGTRIDSETSERIEQHRFKALRTLNWRSSALDFRSASALIRSLNAPAPLDQFARMSTADDLSSLKTLAQLPDIADIAKAPAATARLWDVCRIPDFRKTMADVHTRLLAQIYRHLMTENGVVPDDWMARHVSRLDRTEGDIDTLAGRIAHIRTWTYVANRPDWLDDPGHWRERTRAVEDKLSDALHDRLSQRFVDKRASVLMRRLGAKEEIFAVVKSDGDIMVEDQFVGQLKGLRFVPDPLAERSQGRLLLGAAVRALAREIDTRITKLEGADDGEIELKTDDGLARPTIWWREGVIARIVAGADKLSPRVRLLPNDLLDVRAGKRTVARLQLWLDREIARRVAPLIALHEALVEAPGETAPHKTLSGPARGLTFQMIERLGWVRRADVWALIRSLSKSQRARLRGHGVRFGAVVIFMPSLLKPGAAGFCQLLWAVHAADPGVSKALKRRRISIDVDTGIPPEYYRSAGYLAIADRAYRIDRLERLAGAARKSAESGMALSAKTLMTKVRCDAKALAGVLEVLGYEARPADDDTIVIRRAKPRKQRRPRPKPGVARSLSPFAGLAALKRPRRSA